MYIIKSVYPLFDPEKELYESHVGLDDQKKTLLLSCWGVTEAQSNQLAQGMVKKLEDYIIEERNTVAEIPEQFKKYPLTIEECITPTQFFIGELEKLVRSAQDCGNTQLESILQRLVGVVAAGDEFFYLMETKGLALKLMQRIEQQQVDQKNKLN